MAAVQHPNPPAAWDRHCHVGMALAIGLTTFAGFGASVCLARLRGARPLRPVVLWCGLAILRSGPLRPAGRCVAWHARAAYPIG